MDLLLVFYGYLTQTSHRDYLPCLFNRIILRMFSNLFGTNYSKLKAVIASSSHRCGQDDVNLYYIITSGFTPLLLISTQQLAGHNQHCRDVFLNLLEKYLED